MILQPAIRKDDKADYFHLSVGTWPVCAVKSRRTAILIWQYVFAHLEQLPNLSPADLATMAGALVSQVLSLPATDLEPAVSKYHPVSSRWGRKLLEQFRQLVAPERELVVDTNMQTDGSVAIAMQANVVADGSPIVPLQ